MRRLRNAVKREGAGERNRNKRWKMPGGRKTKRGESAGGNSRKLKRRGFRLSGRSAAQRDVHRGRRRPSKLKCKLSGNNAVVSAVRNARRSVAYRWIVILDADLSLTLA
jgi:hypothetical protein